MDKEQTVKDEVKEEPQPVELSEFLESTPPSQKTMISEMVDFNTRSVVPYFLKPEIQLHCPSDTCNGTRFFRCIKSGNQEISASYFTVFYLTYVCSNCMKTEKTFSLAAKRSEEGKSGECFKFGELPPYGPPTPARMLRLIQPDRELFLKGRRCENQGLGIGAFGYYRRVVENQKNRILDEIIKVSQKLNAAPDIIAALEGAKKEFMFTKAVETLKDAMPQALLINGHNPLVLLHSALSDGLHDQTDEHCLELASSIRVVLAELSERLGQALKDDAELTNALSKLMTKKNIKNPTSPKAI